MQNKLNWQSSIDDIYECTFIGILFHSFILYVYLYRVQRFTVHGDNKIVTKLLALCHEHNSENPCEDFEDLTFRCTLRRYFKTRCLF